MIIKQLIKEYHIAALFLLLIMSFMPKQRVPDIQDDKYGIYTNMEASEGDFSGIEIFLLPSNEGPYLLFQEAEGWPKKPLLLKARIGGTKSSDNNKIRFSHPELGIFEGEITKGVLEGEFTDPKIRINLTKGKSIWQ